MTPEEHPFLHIQVPSGPMAKTPDSAFETLLSDLRRSGSFSYRRERNRRAVDRCLPLIQEQIDREDASLAIDRIQQLARFSQLPEADILRMLPRPPSMVDLRDALIRALNRNLPAELVDDAMSDVVSIWKNAKRKEVHLFCGWDSALVHLLDHDELVRDEVEMSIGSSFGEPIKLHVHPTI